MSDGDAGQSTTILVSFVALAVLLPLRFVVTASCPTVRAAVEAVLPG